ncbi:MAG: DUF1330 domain-containing protein [Thermomicrobiales bacterium]|nr:DUF1330 domain-containing protein [Thermomicrobiales bacterium]
MAAYIIANVEVTDPEGYREYSRQVPASLEPFGGRFVVRAGAAERLEGEATPHRVVVIEFPSVDAAKAWHASPAYQTIAKIRHQHSTSHVMFVAEGAPPQV